MKLIKPPTMRPPDRGWTYVIEPDANAVPVGRRVIAGDGQVLSVRHHGHPGRLQLHNPHRFPRATALRVLCAAGEAGMPDGTTLTLVPEGALAVPAGHGRCLVNGSAAGGEGGTRYQLVEALRALPLAPGSAPAVGELPEFPVRRVLFFESLMNADLPHNDAELAQGVLHIASALRQVGSEPVFARVKMAIIGTQRGVTGLESLSDAFVSGPVELVCITLLEGYWEGVKNLIANLRQLGCRAHVAVGGVMPTLTPDVVAAHLPDVSFVCRGAGEVFVPALARILGEKASIDLPFSVAQRQALMGLDGLWAVDPAGQWLVAGNPAAVVEVPDLDRVELDLGLLRPVHFSAGLELATSRGCVHRCTFCSILGRERYQARSSGGLIELLGRYDQRIRELFGEHPPRNSRRVHLSDDDFACDRARAASFFRALLHTPFRLASAQVSVADLCLPGRSPPELDRELLDSIRPECFDDSSRPLRDRDFVADHRSRGWSSYLQIGVEAFCDAELTRLGKGYHRAELRLVVARLAEREIHHDAYFILSNRDTRFTDLVDGLDEVVRLKTLFPRWFHIRFPVVPRLVSYATSASWRRLVRAGDHGAFVTRDHLAVAGHPEFDYPLIDHDQPRDPLVRTFVDEQLFTDEQRYAGTFSRLQRRLVEAWADGRDPEVEYASRLVDDRHRRRLFELLDLARRADRSPASRGPGEPLAAAAGIQADALKRRCDEVLGPTETWLPAYQRYAMGGVTRLVVIPTWQCELRCNYCYIPKQDGRVMDSATLRRAVDLLCSSERKELTLQFFGGEALLEWGLVRDGIAWAHARAGVLGRRLDFVLSSNGYSLDGEKLDFLRGYPVKLELSLDGAPDTQRRFRPAARPGQDSYALGIAPRARVILESGLAYDVIMVVHPEHVDRVADNYLHIVDLGFLRVQINFALGKMWSPAHRQVLAAQLFRLAGELRRRPEVVLVNAENPPMPVRLNGEITVDWDGSVYGGNAFLHETEHKARFRRGHLDDLLHFDRYWMDAPSNTELMAWSYPAAMTANNLKVGAVMSDFLRWWRSDRGVGQTDGSGAGAVR